VVVPEGAHAEPAGGAAQVVLAPLTPTVMSTKAHAAGVTLGTVPV